LRPLPQCFGGGTSAGLYSHRRVLILGETHSVNRMMRLGPEALLVASRVAPRADLVQYGQLEYARSDVLWVEAAVHARLEVMPVKRSTTAALLSWGRKWFRRADLRVAPIAASPAVRPRAAGTATMGGAAARRASQAPLAALPTTRTGFRPEGEPSSISAVPLYGRA